LQHTYRNKLGEEVRSWYTIDCTDAAAITQKNEASGKQRAMRLVQLMAPTEVRDPLGLEPPPPPPPDAAAAA
jgi:hypothetical protein